MGAWACAYFRPHYGIYNLFNLFTGEWEYYIRIHNIVNSVFVLEKCYRFPNDDVWGYRVRLNEGE